MTKVVVTKHGEFFNRNARYCPECDSDNVTQKENISIRINVLSAHKCNSCGCEWEIVEFVNSKILLPNTNFGVNKHEKIQKIPPIDDIFNRYFSDDKSNKYFN